MSTITINGSVVTESNVTASGSGFRTDATSSRTLYCEWDELETVLVVIMGKYTEIGGQTVQEIEAMPYKDGSILKASGYRYEPIGDAGQDGDGFPSFPFARITADFTPDDIELTDDQDDDDSGEGTWAEESSTSTIKYIQMPRYVARWKSVAGHDGLLKEQGGLPVVITSLTLTRFNVTQIDRSVLTAAGGTSNQNSFFGWPPECLIFSGWSPRRTIDTLGNSSKYTITASFKGRIVKTQAGDVVGWNHQLRPGHDWTEVQVNGGKQFPVYNYRDI